LPLAQQPYSRTRPDGRSNLDAYIVSAFLTFSPRSAPVYVDFFDELRQRGFVDGANLMVEGDRMTTPIRSSLVRI
jgi:hypothetical protein